MSFLTRTSTTTLRTLRFAPRASFSTAFRAQKSTVDAAKDALKAVDRTVSDAAVKGIERGEAVAAATKETIGVNTSKAEGAAQETAYEAKGSANQTAYEAKGSAKETAYEAKGTASELARTASGKASELTGKARGKASEVAGKTKGNVAEIKGEAKAKANQV